MKVVPTVICLLLGGSAALELNTSIEPALQLLQKGRRAVRRARMRRKIGNVNAQSVSRMIRTNQGIQVIGSAKTTHRPIQSGKIVRRQNGLSSEEQAMERVEAEGRALLRRCGRLPPPPPEDMEFEREVAKLRGLLQGCAAHEVHARRWNRVLSPKLIRDYMRYLEWQDKKLARLQQDKPQIIIDSGASAACKDVASRGGNQIVRTEANMSVTPQQERAQNAQVVSGQGIRKSQIGGNMSTNTKDFGTGENRLKMQMTSDRRYMRGSASVKAQFGGRSQAAASGNVTNMRSVGSKSTFSSMGSTSGSHSSRSTFGVSANVSGGGNGYKRSGGYTGVSGSRSLGLSGTTSGSKSTRGSLNVAGGTTNYQSMKASRGGSGMTMSSGRSLNSAGGSGSISGSRGAKFTTSTSGSRVVGASGGVSGSSTLRYMGASRTSGSTTLGNLQAKGSRTSGGSMQVSGSGKLSASGSMRVSGSGSKSSNGSMKVSGSGGTSRSTQVSGSASRTTGGAVSMQASSSKTSMSAGGKASGASKSTSGSSLSASASGSVRR